MRVIIFLLVVTFSAIGCNKKGITYTIEGQISDQSLGGGLSGATIKLYAFAPGSTAAGEPVASTTTGSDGTYSFSVERSKVEKYYLKVSKSQYFDGSIEFTADALDPKAVNTYNLSIPAKSWVRLHFVNPDGIQNLHYNRQQGKEGCTECCPSGDQWLYGVTDTSIYCINNGNSTYGIYYWVVGGDHGPVSVVTVPFDTTEILVTY